MSKGGSSGGKGSGGGGRPANAPSTTGNPSGGGRGNTIGKNEEARGKKMRHFSVLRPDGTQTQKPRTNNL